MGESPTFAERLGSFIGDEPDHRMSIRSFSDAMLKRTPRPRGSTRAMIHRYLKKDGPEPPPEFIRAAADILVTNPEWLAFGKGHRTPEEEAAGAVADARPPDDDVNILTADPADIEKGFLDGLPGLGRAGVASWHVLGDLYSQYSRSRTHIMVREIHEAGAPDDPLAYKKVFRRAQIAEAKQVAKIVGAGATAAGVRQVRKEKGG